MTYRSVVLAQTPLAYYTLDEITGNTYVDIANANNLTDPNTLVVQNVTPPVGVGGKAITFGAGQTITGTITGIPSGTGDSVTVTGWIKWDGVENAALLWGWNGPTDVGFIDYGGGNTGFGFNTGGGDIYGFDATTAGMANTWCHVAVVYKNNQLYTISSKIYLNGSVQSLSQLAGAAGSTGFTPIVFLAGWGAGGSNRFSGSMDEVAYFDRELTSGEVLAEWQASQTTYSVGQAQAKIKIIGSAFGQTTALINSPHKQAKGQANADIKRTNRGFGQANAYILRQYGTGQAQAQIFTLKLGGGQAQAQIITTNAQQFGSAMADIKRTFRGYGQAQTIVGHRTRLAQAQAQINAFNIVKTGYAQATILRQPTTVPTSLENSASATYVARFNGYDLPGYVQEETFESIENIHTYMGPYRNMYGSSGREQLLSLNTGLQNKTITLKEKLIGFNYRDVKDQVQRAATIVNSTSQYAKLFIENTDTYYLAMGKTLSFEQDAHQKGTTLDYSVEFDAKPFLFSDTVNSVTGITTLTTTGRTLFDGAWTPTTVTMTGTDIAISGYTNTGEQAGYISVSGSVTNLVVTSEDYTAIMDDTNRNDVIRNLDYYLYVGVGVTNFVVTGATDCTITWRNRWYL